MIIKYIIVVLLLLPVHVFADDEVLDWYPVVASCTTPATHTYDQGFEDAFPITNFALTGTPTSEYTLTGTPPASSCSKGFYFTDTGVNYARYDYGSTLSSGFYFRIDLKYTAGLNAAWLDMPFFSFTEADNGYNSQEVQGLIFSTGGGGELKLNTHVSATQIIDAPTVDTWYTITGKIVSGDSWIKVNGGSPITITPNFTYAARYFWFGNVGGDGNGAAMQIGYFAIDDTEITSD